MSEPDTAAKVFKHGDQNQPSAHELLLIPANIRSDEGSQTKQSAHESFKRLPNKDYHPTVVTAKPATEEDQVANGNEQSYPSQDQDSSKSPRDQESSKLQQDQDSTFQLQEAEQWGKSPEAQASKLNTAASSQRTEAVGNVTTVATVALRY